MEQKKLPIENNQILWPKINVGDSYCIGLSKMSNNHPTYTYEENIFGITNDMGVNVTMISDEYEIKIKHGNHFNSVVSNYVPINIVIICSDSDYKNLVYLEGLFQENDDNLVEQGIKLKVVYTNKDGKGEGEIKQTWLDWVSRNKLNFS